MARSGVRDFFMKDTGHVGLVVTTVDDDADSLVEFLTDRGTFTLDIDEAEELITVLQDGVDAFDVAESDRAAAAYEAERLAEVRANFKRGELLRVTEGNSVFPEGEYVFFLQRDDHAPLVTSCPDVTEWDGRYCGYVRQEDLKPVL